MASKYERDLEEVTFGLEEFSFPVTVLSWNIFGPGRADPRRKMIDSVVSCIDPDVMLLQETKDSIICPKSVLRQLSIFDKYKSKQAGDREEAQVFYKENMFEEVLSTVTFELNDILEEMFPEDETRQLRSGLGPADVVWDRTCVVHLRHKLTEREIIFISYHNIRKGGSVRTKASEFCEIIAKLHEYAKCCVIAGVDFNCSDFDSTDVTVPDYEMTLRRQEQKKKKKIDYFILSDNPPVDCVVESFDIFPQNKKAPFYKILQGLLLRYTEEEYEQANDHDPLTLSMEIS